MSYDPTGECHTLEEFVYVAFETAGLNWRENVEVEENLFRPSDLTMSRANTDRAARNLNWKAKNICLK
jgi:GDPmannose 4,6-dehydratase